MSEIRFQHLLCYYDKQGQVCRVQPQAFKRGPALCSKKSVYNHTEEKNPGSLDGTILNPCGGIKEYFYILKMSD